MMFLRHLAYKSALAAEPGLGYKYSHFLYLREDNAFVEPPAGFEGAPQDLDVSIWHHIQTMSPAMVKVDKYCGQDAWSDKIYLAGREGAAILFKDSLREHASDMSRWVNRGGRKRGHTNMQSEEWLQYLMQVSGVNVSLADFHRVDIRYMPDAAKPCVHENYFLCTADPGKIYEQCVCPEKLKLKKR